MISLPHSQKKGMCRLGKDLKGKNLGTGISQRRDGSYQGRFVNRFGDRQTVYGQTIKEVKNKLTIAKAEDAQKKNVVNPNLTLDQWYEKWMRVYKNPVVRANTIRQYQYIYGHNISPYLGKRKLIDITKLMVTDVMNELKEKGYEWESLNKVKVLLTDMFDRAIEDEFAVRNPAKGARNPRNKPQKEIKALSQDDQRVFFQCSAGTFYDNLFRVAINSGLRPGELFALTEDDIDLQKMEITVRKTLLYQKLDGDTGKTFHMEEPKTKTSYRTVPINKYCKEALERQIILHKILKNNSPYKSKLEFPDLLFTTKFCTPLNSQIYCDAIEKIINEINLARDPLDMMEKFSGHCFRHTFATRCFEAGIQPKTVQAYLGHATLQMTMDLYTSVMDKKKADDMQLLEDTVKLDNVDEYVQENKIIKFA